jgi:hypothetical protein
LRVLLVLAGLVLIALAATWAVLAIGEGTATVRLSEHGFEFQASGCFALFTGFFWTFLRAFKSLVAILSTMSLLFLSATFLGPGSVPAPVPLHPVPTLPHPHPEGPLLLFAFFLVVISVLILAYVVMAFRDRKNSNSSWLSLVTTAAVGAAASGLVIFAIFAALLSNIL